MMAEPTIETYKEPAVRVVSPDIQIGTLFNRTAVAKTHYEVLGLGFDANVEEIHNAKQAADALLQPRTLHPKATFIMARLNHSYRVLADAAMRRDYDRHLCIVGNKDETRSSTPGEESRLTGDASAGAPSVVSETQARRRQTGPLSFRSEAWSVDDSVDRRRYKRFGLTVPAYVRGYEHNTGWWQEWTQTIDVSRSGLAFYIRQGLSPETLLHVTFAMPVDFRTCQFRSPDYSVYAIVRRTGVVENGTRTMAAVSLIGELAQNGFAPSAWGEHWKAEQVERGGANVDAGRSA